MSASGQPDDPLAQPRMTIEGRLKPPRRGRPNDRRPDRLGVRGLVKAICLSLIGAEKREEPPHPLIVIDAPNLFQSVLGDLNGVSKIPLDHKARHAVSPLASLPTRLWPASLSRVT